MKIAIVGAGKLGLRVIESMITGGNSITVIDKDEELLERLSTQMDVMTIAGNAKSTSFLREHNIGSYDFLVAVTGNDEKNIVIASFAKALGCSKVIARLRDPEHMNQIEFIKEVMSIDFIINPDLLITNEIYKYLIEKNTLTNGVFTSSKTSLLECHAYKIPKLINQKIIDIGDVLPNMLIGAIDRNGKVIIPHGDTEILNDDILYIVGEKLEIASLSKHTIEKGKYTDIQRVMIIGGGKTGLYLASKLSDFGIFVKIIEIDKDRCHYLSTHLNNVMILHGDATDLTLLEEENFEEMDAFITATGFDEDNLLLALIAKSHGIEDVIAKISRESYEEIISKMGIDIALNPLDISANNIVRYIQGTKNILSSTLIQGQAEIIEIVADDRMPITFEPLNELDLPEGILIASIHRGRQVIIPDGNAQIQDGDIVMILSLLNETEDLEKLINIKDKLGFFRGVLK